MSRCPDNLRSQALARCQAGGVLLEFALVVWFLVFLLLSAFDFGSLFHDYYVISQITREGARSASMVPGLVGPSEVTSLPTEEERLKCAEVIESPRTVEARPCALISAYFRTLAVMRISGIDPSATRLYLGYDGAGRIKVAISKRTNLLFPPYRLIPLRASTLMPYFGGV